MEFFVVNGVIVSLLSSIKIRINSPIHLEKIQQIEDFDFSKIKSWVAKNFQWALPNPYLNQGIQQLKKYYVLVLLDPLNEHAVSRFVDPFLHAHVVHTEDYHDFCTSVFHQYIHHEPLDEDNIIYSHRVEKLYEHTVKIYQIIFKDPNDIWWPSLSMLPTERGKVVSRNTLNGNKILCDEAMFSKNQILSPVGLH